MASHRVSASTISTIVPGQVVERLKQQARKLKRESMLTHTEALDQVAQNAGFNHWRHVTECHQHIKPAETALKQGCVLLFDQKEIYETELGDDDLFIQDELLEIAFQKTLYEPFINFTDEDDPEGRPLKETMNPSSLEAEYAEWLREECFAYIRLDESASGWPLERIMRAIESRFFWKPYWIIHKGIPIDTYSLPATDAQGNVVGVRF